MSRDQRGRIGARAARRVVRALCLLAVLLCAACQSSGGMGLGVESGAPGWGSFSSGRMFGAPL